MNNRHLRRSALLAYGLLLGCASRVGASAYEASENIAVSDGSTRFPAETVFVARQQQNGTLLWATKQTLHNAHTGAEYAFPAPGFVCKRITWSADQKRLLIQGVEADAYEDSFVTDAYILDATSLRLVRHLKTPVAWWQGVHHAFLEADPQRIVSSIGRRYSVPHDVEILAADSQTGCLLRAALLPRQRHDRERGPSYLLQLWKLNAQGKWQCVRTVGKTHFDPGSTGIPRMFGIAGRRRIIVSRPVGAAFEIPQLAEGRRITEAFPRPNEDNIYFMSERGPYAADNTLFGLVRPIGWSKPDKRKFLYQVTDKTSILQQIGADVVFVYYDPIRCAIGVGSTTPSGVVVRYIVVKDTTKYGRFQ